MSLSESDRAAIRDAVRNWPPLSDDDVAHLAALLAPATPGGEHDRRRVA